MRLPRFGARRARAQARPRSAPPAKPLGPSAPRELRRGDFTAGNPIASSLSRLASYEVPRGDLFEVDAARPFRMAIKAGNAFTVTSDAAGEATLDFAAAGFDMIESHRAAPALPSTNNPNVVVIDAGGAKVTIKSINYATGSVVVQGLAASTADIPLTGYALHGNGEIKIRAVNPSGSDVQAVELYNDTFAALHEVDQSNGETAPRFERNQIGRYPLGPKWVLALEVDSNLEVSFDAAAENIVEIHGYRMPIEVLDSARLNRDIYSRLR